MWNDERRREWEALQEAFDPEDRCSEPDEGERPVERIELDFAIPIFMSRDHQRRLHELMDDIVKDPKNQVQEGVHWVSGGGSKPSWSASDAAFLGKPGNGDPSVANGDEPTFDDSVFVLTTACRAFTRGEERGRKLAARAKRAAKGE